MISYRFVHISSQKGVLFLRQPVECQTRYNVTAVDTKLNLLNLIGFLHLQ